MLLNRSLLTFLLTSLLGGCFNEQIEDSARIEIQAVKVITPTITPILPIQTKKKKTVKAVIIKSKPVVVTKVLKKKAKLKDKITISQAAVNKVEIKLPTNETKVEDKKITQSISAGLNTNNHITSSEEKGYDSDFEYKLTYQMNSEYSALFRLKVTKDLTDSYADELADTQITFKKKGWELSKDLTLSPSFRTVLPTSKKSKRATEMLVSFELGTTLAFKMNDKFSLSYTPKFVKSFHQHTTTRNHKTNNEYKIKQFYGARYSFAENWAISPLIIYSTAWSYSGRRKNPAYYSIIDITRSFKNGLSIGAGSVQGGSVVERETGPDDSVVIYDRDTIEYYLNVGLLF